MNLRTETITLLEQLPSLGQVSETAYDTAWVAQLGDIAPHLSKPALAWLRENQLPDGSWGASELCYHHDRVLSTLPALIALAKNGDQSDKHRIEKAKQAVSKHLHNIKYDLAGETIGFEGIVPTLLSEANNMDLLQLNGSRFPQQLIKQRNRKLNSLPNGQINHRVPLSFSAEMAGKDHIHLLDIENLQGASGSVGQNPATTAYFLSHIDAGNQSALNYLNRYAPTGAAPHFAPFDIFEQGWSIWNLSLPENLLDHIEPHLINQCLDWLEYAFHPEYGSAFTVAFASTDGDGSSLLFELLTSFGRTTSTAPLKFYESETHFYCYHHESNPSTSTNIHMLGAWRAYGLTPDAPEAAKIINFLRKSQYKKGFWIDKWHVSPFYPTSHLIINAVGYIDELATDAINWILGSQNPDGSWGFYLPSAEETAYCLQALAIAKRNGYPIPIQSIRQGAEWLKENSAPPYPRLWIGKTLYTPTLVNRSAIISALMLAQETT